MLNRIRFFFRGAAISETTVVFLQMPGLSEALILEGATDAGLVQKLTVVFVMVRRATRYTVFLYGGGYL